MSTTEPASPARPRPRHVTVAGRRVCHRVDGDGPPVLLLHGIGRTMRDFDDLHERLAQRFRVHSVDLPGYGGSLPMTAPYTLPELAGFVGRYLDVVGVDRPVHLVGNSLGGAVAMQFAATEPARVASLGFGKEVTILLRLLALRPFGRLLLRPSRWSARRAERALFHDAAFATAERIAYALEVARQPHAARVMLETAHHLGTLRGVSPHPDAPAPRPHPPVQRLRAHAADRTRGGVPPPAGRLLGGGLPGRGPGRQRRRPVMTLPGSPVAGPAR
ncbi:alpha/beta fold hydrolase [Micromonospora sp. WMMD558]|uniref:alpha/beta fold hydrolase n=1 Tax=Micromonospora sp. WMMD558 TaxID=3403462 RepID=UPI003BF4CC92